MIKHSDYNPHEVELFLKKHNPQVNIYLKLEKREDMTEYQMHTSSSLRYLKLPKGWHYYGSSVLTNRSSSAKEVYYIRFIVDL